LEKNQSGTWCRVENVSVFFLTSKRSLVGIGQLSDHASLPFASYIRIEMSSSHRVLVLSGIIYPTPVMREEAKRKKEVPQTITVGWDRRHHQRRISIHRPLESVYTFVTDVPEKVTQ
jgi:hypothetical protein